jgi:AcrR family transcriptional regulator
MPVRDEKYLQEQRQRIMEAAFRCFSRQGYQKTSMRAICKEAGLAVGTLYLHFKDRNDILASMKGMANERPLEEAKFKDWSEFLGYFHFIIDLQDNPASMKYVVCDMKLAAEAQSNDELATLFKEGHREMLGWLNKWLCEFVAQGEIELPLGIDTTARSLRYLLLGILNCQLFEEKKERETLVEVFDKTLSSMVVIPDRPQT